MGERLSEPEHVAVLEAGEVELSRLGKDWLWRVGSWLSIGESGHLDLTVWKGVEHELVVGGGWCSIDEVVLSGESPEGLITIWSSDDILGNNELLVPALSISGPGELSIGSSTEEGNGGNNSGGKTK